MNLVNEIFDFVAGLGEDYWSVGDMRAPKSKSAKELLGRIAECAYELNTFTPDVALNYIGNTKIEEGVFEAFEKTVSLPPLLSVAYDSKIGERFRGDNELEKLEWTLERSIALLIHDEEGDGLYSLGKECGRAFNIDFELEDYEDGDLNALVLLKWEDVENVYFDPCKNYMVVLTQRQFSQLMGLREEINFFNSPPQAYYIEEWRVISLHWLDWYSYNRFEDFIIPDASDTFAMDLSALAFLKK